MRWRKRAFCTTRCEPMYGEQRKQLREAAPRLHRLVRPRSAQAMKWDIRSGRAKSGLAAVERRWALSPGLHKICAYMAEQQALQ